MRRSWFFIVLIVVVLVIGFMLKANKPQDRDLDRVFTPFSPPIHLEVWDSNEPMEMIDSLITPPSCSTRLLSTRVPRKSMLENDWITEIEKNLKSARQAVVTQLNQDKAITYGFQGYNVYIDTDSERAIRDVELQVSYLITTLGPDQDAALATTLTLQGFPTEISSYIMGSCEH